MKEGRAELPAVSWAAVLAAAAAGFGCGYHPLFDAQRATREQFAVTGETPKVAEATVTSGIEAGVRAGLARAGALRVDGRYPLVRVELLRIDQASEGVRLDPENGLLARGTRVGVVARAWVEREAGAARERDTGDERATEIVERESDVVLGRIHLEDAANAAARRLGERLARRILGQPAVVDDSP